MNQDNLEKTGLTNVENHKPVVLIAEDDRNMRDLIARVLSESSMEFDTVWGEGIAHFLGDLLATRSGQRGLRYAWQGRVLSMELEDDRTLRLEVDEYSELLRALSFIIR